VRKTNADGSRTNPVKHLAADGTVNASSTETVSVNNRDGVWSGPELVKSVVVDAVIQARTATTWARNADGSITGKSVAVTSADGFERIRPKVRPEPQLRLAA
jgi:hypothetical protein